MNVLVSQLHSEKIFPYIIESVIYTGCLQTVPKCKGEFEWYRKWAISQEHSKLKFADGVASTSS